jgi:hypothetical protein
MPVEVIPAKAGILVRDDFNAMPDLFEQIRFRPNEQWTNELSIFSGSAVFNHKVKEKKT